MSQLSFDLSQLEAMAAEAQQAQQLTPTYDDLWNAKLYPDGELLNEHGETESEVVLNGGEFWPDWQKIAADKIKPQLILMAEGPHGIYIMNNVAGDVSPIDRGMICFAKGCKPSDGQAMLNKQAELFGYDGHSFVLPKNWLKQAKQAGKQALIIKVQDAQCELYLS